jgi:Holliday junction resolvase
MGMTPEGKVKNAVKKLLKQHGIYFYMPVQNGMGVVGIPDIIACWDGRFLAIETKAPGKRNNTTANQDVQLALISGAGGIALVVDDVKLVEELLSTVKPWDHPIHFPITDRDEDEN